MHAGGLARSLRKLRPQLKLEAIGGRYLREAGVEVLQDTVTKAAFGLRAFGRAFEVAALLRKLRRRWDLQGPPKLVICCDSWTMNKHVLALAREFGCQTMYYVSPQVWASREGRVEKMAQLVDRLACILPFEEQWLRDRGVHATFVGHPLFDELPDKSPDFPENERFPNRPPRIALNFGSRLGVARANLPPMLKAVSLIFQAFPAASFVTPVVPATAAYVREAVGERIEVSDDFDNALSGCDLAITVSGTATLHTAAHGVPMVVVYRGNPLLWHGIGRFLIKTRTFALVNLLHPARQRVVEEFIPWFGDPEPVAKAAVTLLQDPATLAAQRAKLAEVVDPLRKKGAGENAARIALELLDGEKQGI